MGPLALWVRALSVPLTGMTTISPVRLFCHGEAGVSAPASVVSASLTPQCAAMAATYPAMAYTFYISFMFIIVNLVLWMFLAIILESYTIVRQASGVDRGVKHAAGHLPRHSRALRSPFSGRHSGMILAPP